MSKQSPPTSSRCANAGTSNYPKIDVPTLARGLGIDNLDKALEALKAFYAVVDERVSKTTGHLNLPCHKGCDLCCHQSVFLTPIEFFAVWNYVQNELTDSDRAQIIADGLAIYDKFKDKIEALNQPPPEGERDHFSIARQIAFRCPLLSAEGACRVYPVRELYARLFGASFLQAGEVYGCEIVDDHLSGKTVSLVSVKGYAQVLRDLPGTNMRQIYPFYIHALYGNRT